MQETIIMQNYIKIINEFRNLIDFINYDDILHEKMFQILLNHFNFVATGIFFNSPDSYEMNSLELFTKNININFDEIKTKFFNSISEYKQIIKSTVKVHYCERNTESPELKSELILPFVFNGKLIGSICMFSNREIFDNNIDIFNLIVKEFLSIFKLKYIYTEQTYKSSIDSLTGLYNRNQFDIGLKQEFNRAKRYETPFSIAMIDIDHFKNINDSFGHQFGDFILKEVTNIIQHSFRKTDIVYRYGGEEIVIIMPETTADNAFLPLEKLRKNIETHKFNNKHITISIGVANYEKTSQNENEIVKNADEKLYKAKKTGRNKICLWKFVNIYPILLKNSQTYTVIPCICRV